MYEEGTDQEKCMKRAYNIHITSIHASKTIFWRMTYTSVAFYQLKSTYVIESKIWKCLSNGRENLIKWSLEHSQGMFILMYNIFGKGKWDVKQIWWWLYIYIKKLYL